MNLSFLVPFCISTLMIVMLFYYLTKSNKIILSFNQALLILIIKCIVGCVYGYLFLKVYKGDDTWQYHQLSLQEYAVLKQHPWDFFADLFVHHYKQSQTLTFFNSQSSYWKDLQYNILIKLLAIFNLFSRGHYYINVLFFNVVTFWGHYFLYKLIVSYLPDRKQLLFLVIFLFPPLLFWESGIRKDGLIFPAITGCIYYFTVYVQSKGLKPLFLCFIFFGLTFLIRNFVALSLVPVFIAYYISVVYKKKAAPVFMITLGTACILFFLTTFAPDNLNLPKQMAERQHKFLQLKGNSFLEIETLTDNVLSYIKDLPAAVNHSFLRPYITEGKSPLLLVAALENLLMIVIIIIALINYHSLLNILKQPIWLLLISFSILNYLMIGYTVPFFGAIIRYRILFEVLLIIPLMDCADKKYLVCKIPLLNKIV